MNIKEFEDQFNQKFSIDVDGDFNESIVKDMLDNDEDGECIDAAKNESFDLGLSFDTDHDPDQSYQNESYNTSNNGLNLSFFNENDDSIIDDLYVGSTDTEKEFDLDVEIDALDVLSDAGDDEYESPIDDDEDGECIDLTEEC